MRMSRIALATLSLPLAFAACGDGGDSAADQPEGPPVVTSEEPELSTGDLLGLDRANVAAFTPWRGGTMTRNASDVAPTATQLGIEALTADGFDRIVLNFRRGTPAPGYRIRAAGSEPETLCGEETTIEESGVLIQLTPATVRNDAGETTMDTGDVDLGLPVATSARLVCEGAREVVWFVATEPEAVEVRALNLLMPDRIAVDIRAAAAEMPAAASPDTSGTGDETGNE